MCLVQVRSAYKALHLLGSGARLIFLQCSVMATQEQFAAVMQQHAQLLATVHQLVQMQQAQQAAAGAAPPSGSEQAGFAQRGL